MGIVRFRTWVLGLVLLGLGTVTQAQAVRALSISGATTVQPIADGVAELFTRKTGIPVAVSGGGSGTGLQNAVSGTADIGMVSRALRDAEKQTVSYLTAGFDALVFIVNERNPLTGIDRETVVSLFSGGVRQWNEIAAWDAPVVLVTKEVGRATLDLFEGYSGLHHPDKQAGSLGSVVAESTEIGANIEALMLVGGLPGAIGYVSMGAANSLVESGMPVRVLDLDGVPPTVMNVLSGAYPVGRELNFVFHDREGSTGVFLELVQSAEGRVIVEREGFIPAEGS